MPPPLVRQGRLGQTISWCGLTCTPELWLLKEDDEAEVQMLAADPQPEGELVCLGCILDTAVLLPDGGQGKNVVRWGKCTICEHLSSLLPLSLQPPP